MKRLFLLLCVVLLSSCENKRDSSPDPGSFQSPKEVSTSIFEKEGEDDSERTKILSNPVVENLLYYTMDSGYFSKTNYLLLREATPEEIDQNTFSITDYYLRSTEEASDSEGHLAHDYGVYEKVYQSGGGSTQTKLTTLQTSGLYIIGFGAPNMDYVTSLRRDSEEAAENYFNSRLKEIATYYLAIEVDDGPMAVYSMAFRLDLPHPQIISLQDIDPEKTSPVIQTISTSPFYEQIHAAELRGEIPEDPIKIQDLKTAEFYGDQYTSFSLIANYRRRPNPFIGHFMYINDDLDTIFTPRGYWSHFFLLDINQNSQLDYVYKDVYGQNFVINIDGITVKEHPYKDDNPINH
jgi:hypothetical protein